MQIRPLSLLTLAVIFTLLAPYQPVLAARGIPGSSEFGYGAHLNMNGPFPIEGVRLASDLQLDWMRIEISWQAIAPKHGTMDWNRVDPVLQASTYNGPSILVSVVDPPEWAQTAQGPDPVFVAQFVIQLVQRYPKQVKAIEIFPGANTRSGWGRQPNPKAYLKVIQAAQSSLQMLQSKLFLVAGGLQPVPSPSDPSQAMDDAVFLQALYNAGLKNTVNIISVDASNLTGEPLQIPDKREPRVLRHYEEIRTIMLRNKHDNGLIWVTHLSPPDGKIQPEDEKYQEKSNQADWLSQAYGQIKSQLYIGVAFIEGINPSLSTPGAIALIENSGDYHPFYRNLRELIIINLADTSHIRPGRAKNQPLIKNIK